jgi:hypothetical protein
VLLLGAAAQAIFPSCSSDDTTSGSSTASTGAGGSSASSTTASGGGTTTTTASSTSSAAGGNAGTSGAGGTGSSAGGAGGNGGSGTGGTRAGAGGGDAGSPRDASADREGTDGGNCAGHAVSFNANIAGNNDPAMARVVVDFGNSTDLPTGNANRTIEFWAYLLTSSWAGDANTMFFYGTNNRVADGFGLDFGGTPGTIDPFTNAIFDNDNQPSGLNPAMNQWAHFAMTWDGTAVRAFVNGVQKAMKTSTSAQTTLMTGRTPLIIGGYPPAYFNGYIDEFRIWSVARSAAEITSTMNKTLAGDEAGLTGYWKFDETSGTTAMDSTTAAGHTAHNGTLMAQSANQVPTWVVSTAPLACP